MKNFLFSNLKKCLNSLQAREKTGERAAEYKPR